MISIGKNHYVAVTNDVGLIVSGMECKRSDKPTLINEIFLLVMQDYKQNIDLVPRLQRAFRDLKDRKVSSDMLIISTRLQKMVRLCKKILNNTRYGKCNARRQANLSAFTKQVWMMDAAAYRLN
ncbi:MAG: hypothetical protein WAM14_00090 [Candidatus Nitrosopolaris sp.]